VFPPAIELQRGLQHVKLFGHGYLVHLPGINETRKQELNTFAPYESMSFSNAALLPSRATICKDVVPSGSMHDAHAPS